MAKPPAPSRVQLVRPTTQSLEVSWTGSPTVQYYILQIQKYDIPPTAAAAAPTTPAAIASIRPTPPVTPVLASTPPPAQSPLPTLASVVRGVQQSPVRVASPGTKVLMSPVQMSPRMAVAGGPNVIRVRSPAVVANAADPTQAIATTMAQTSSALSGMTTLADAAAAIPKISMNNAIGGIPPGSTIRMKSVAPQARQVRLAAPGANVLRAASPQQQQQQQPGQQNKQIIIQKPSSMQGQNIAGQPQIVHLLKTAGQGTVGMPKVSIVPGKTVPISGTKTPGGQTILRLVNPNSVAGSKILTVKNSSFMAMSKSQSIPGKPTIVITKPGGNIGGRNQIIMVTTSGGLRAMPTITTAQAGGGGAITTPVNVLSAANHVTNQQGMKMIVVSSGAMGTSATNKPITINVPGQGGKMVTIATKGAQQTIFNPNKIINMPKGQVGRGLGCEGGNVEY